MKKIVRKDNLRRKKILSIGLVLFLFMGIGYSVLTTNLNISGSIEVSKYESPYLYDVLKFEAINNGLARKYTGNHHDSFTEEPSKDIYYWYAANDNQANQILDKNNVIFADHCWQMIRTTDTGGVKLLYNGEVENGQCLDTRGNHVGYQSITNTNIPDTYLSSNYWYGTDYTYDSTNNVFSISGTTEQVTWSDSTYQSLIGKYTCKNTNSTGTCSTLYYIEDYESNTRGIVIPLTTNSHYSQFGTIHFNKMVNSVASVGYMYNTFYSKHSKSYTKDEVFGSASINVNSWFADGISYDAVNDKYSLVNPYQISSADDYPSLAGKYTFNNSTQTYTSSSIRYIGGVNNNKYYYIALKDGNDYNYYYSNLTYGSSYVDNGNGTYTINNPTVLSLTDWFLNYSNVINNYVCKNAVNNTCSNPWYIVGFTFTKIVYLDVVNEYKYAKGFTYDVNTNTYTLNNDSVTFWNVNDSTDYSNLNNAHYTCWDVSGQCSTISYINYFEPNGTYGIKAEYIDLTDGKSIEDAIDEMLNNNNINVFNTTLKTGIDEWYKKYLLDYDEYIEDTIFCNDRKIIALNGWNPNGGNVLWQNDWVPDVNVTNYNLLFNGYNRDLSLSCTNDTDKFCINNNRAKLNYKVGLLTAPEVEMLNNDIVRKSGTDYWLLTPFFYGGDARFFGIYDNGSFFRPANTHSSGLRPSISLKPGIEFIYGDGSMTDPFVVKTMENNCTFNGTMEQGAEFVDGQYTYRYMQHQGFRLGMNPTLEWKNMTTDGWGVVLTNKNSTDPVNTKLCTTINGKPVTSLDFTYYDSQASSIDLSNSNTSKITSMISTFESSAATNINLTGLDTSNVTIMSGMFAGTNVTSLNLSSFDTGNVTDMSFMFMGSQLTSLDVSNFDTSKVVNMENMFAESHITELDLSSFDIDENVLMEAVVASGTISKVIVKSDTIAELINNTYTNTCSNPDIYVGNVLKYDYEVCPNN